MNRPPDLLVSVHDVMPATLERVQGLLDRLTASACTPVYLLVVPGKAWTPADIDCLRAWVAQGHHLAGHGWFHRAMSIRGVRHHLHSSLMSRNVAEHLSLDAAAIVALMRRCRQWFGHQGLPLPELYVPPAWALGRVPPGRVGDTGFRYIETLGGMQALRDGRWRFTAMPLLGFEADTVFRAGSVRISNGVNYRLASSRWPARLSLHPDDLSLRLAGDLESLLAVPHRCRSLASAVDASLSVGFGRILLRSS